MENGKEKNRKRINPALAIPLVLLVMVSVLSIRPEFLRLIGIRSSTDPDITQRKTVTGSETRLDYVNEDGEIVSVVDKEYSTVVKTMNEEGKCVREEYFDRMGEPVTLAGGYSIVCYTYYGNGKKETETYFDAKGEPVARSGSYYGLCFLYDENGNTTSIYNLGADGKPAPNKDGFTVKLRAYNEHNKIAAEAYVDGEGKTVALPTGESGYINRYDSDGKVSEILYVDGEGRAIMTTRGYAIEKRWYDSEGELERRMYCDTDGNPVVLKRGYAGIRYENGKHIYLGADGNDVFILSMFLHESHWAVCLAGVALCCLVARSSKKVSALLLVLYMVFIAYMTLMYRETGTGQLNLDLFWSYRGLITSKGTRIEVLNNIWLFAPLGAILYKLVPRSWIIFLPMLLSVCIEVIQYVFGIGVFELDDIFNNSLGGLIGVLICRGLRPAKKPEETPEGR